MSEKRQGLKGEGLKEAMVGAQVVIDLTNSPSFEEKAVLEFFETSGRNLHASRGRRRGSASYRAVHRRDRPHRQWLFPRQTRQEKLIEASGIPTPSSARPSSWKSSAASLIRVYFAARSQAKRGGKRRERPE